jgi:hypothetical protein
VKLQYTSQQPLLLRGCRCRSAKVLGQRPIRIRLRCAGGIHKNHFVSIPNPQRAYHPVHQSADPAHFCPKTLLQRRTEPHLAGGFLPHSSPRYHPRLHLRSEPEAADQRHSPEIQSDADSQTTTEHPHDCPNPNVRFDHTRQSSFSLRG